jgi:hypothetical protein
MRAIQAPTRPPRWTWLRNWTILSLGLLLAATGINPLPRFAAAAPQRSEHPISRLFATYWQTHGGLAQYGYPLSDEMSEVSDLDGRPYTVQYFERAVFERHPENAPPYDVLLAQLGTYRYQARYPQGAPGQQANTQQAQFFPETGHTVGGIFLRYWREHGGLSQQGYPISEEFTEVSDLDGRPYTVQYFERAVFEQHPEYAGTPAEVLLAQLGTYRYQARYDAAGRPLPTATPAPATGECTIFPADNIWRRAITDLPVHPQSAAYLESIGTNAFLHAGFGSRLWQGQSLGNPVTIVGPGQALVPVHFTRYAEESDPGPYPIPADARVEGGPDATGDRHVIVWDQGRCAEYDLYQAYPNPDGSWNAAAGATWSLRSNALRPDGWTSADAAGLPLLPGLIRYDEIEAGVIAHAVRFTARVRGVSTGYVWPARHSDGISTSPTALPMGARLRLKPTFDIQGYAPSLQVILKALQTYGMILADTDARTELDIDGDTDPRWDDDLLQALDAVKATDFDVVDESGLMVNPHSAQSR